VLVLDGSQAALHRFLARARLELTRNNKPTATAAPTVEVVSVEAVVGRHSSLRGKLVSQVDFHGDYGINVLGVSRAGYELLHRFHRLKLEPGRHPPAAGLRGRHAHRPSQGLDLLPLVERDVQLGTVRKRFMPAVVLALAMILVGLGAGACGRGLLLPPPLDFLTQYVAYTVCHTLCEMQGSGMSLDPDLYESMRLELRRGSLVLAVLACLRTERYGYTLRRRWPPTGWRWRNRPSIRCCAGWRARAC
jgi:hypothetical protein